MKDRLSLKMARDSLQEIYRSTEAGRHTLTGILERTKAAESSAAKPFDDLFFAGLLGRLVVLEKELKDQILDLCDLDVQALGEKDNKRFSKEQIAKYRQLNARLFAMENRIERDFERLLPQCEQMQKDGLIDDFEIEAEVSLWLDESDPAYRNDDDNILAVFTRNAKDHMNLDFGPDDGENLYKYRFGENDPLQGEHACRLFYEFYARQKLWDEIVRADMIWLDIRVTFQNVYYLKPRSGK